MTGAQSLGTNPPIAIGSVLLEGRALLAPMSGVSDLAMRRIARRFGAALVFSEMVAAETFLQGDAEALMRAEGEGLVPHAVQLVGREARAFGGNRAPGGGRGRGPGRHEYGLPGAAGRGLLWPARR